MPRWLHIVLLFAAASVWSGCKSFLPPSQSSFSRFVGLDNFPGLNRAPDENGKTVFNLPAIKSPIPWNELIVSWNTEAPPGTFLNLEASAIFPDQQTKFYTLGNWSPDGMIFPRTSVRGQQDADGTVATDTLVLARPAEAAQIRVILGGTNGAMPNLKFLGVSFANTKIPPATLPPNYAAWGKIIATPERSQHGYPDEKGWCSPAALSMVLARWAKVLNRPELNLSVPQAAAAVYDHDFGGTGNWPFNTALAGSFSGIRSYVTRFDDLSEAEDWIAAGIPVILSVRWDLLQPGRPPDPAGHLIVCIGFTEKGDIVANDPATRQEKGEPFRRIYSRENVLRAWAKSHHAVYLVYPENAKIPENKFGQW